MDRQKPPLHPFLLRFPDELEVAYSADAFAMARTAARVAIGVVLALFSFWVFVIQPYIMADTLNPPFIKLVNAFILTAMSGGLVLTFVMRGAGSAGLVTTLFMVVIGTTCIIVLRFYPPERRLWAWAFFFIAIAFNSALPYRWSLKTAINLLYGLGYPLLSLHDPLFQPLGVKVMLTDLLSVAVLSSGMGWAFERYARRQWYFLRALDAERERSERLLLNILPASIAARLKAGDTEIVDAVPEATVLFADIVGFTALTETLSAADTWSLLNDLVSRFDLVARQLGVEKIKTIGDCYMAVAGLPEPRADHARRAAEMALDMRETVRRFCLITGRDISIRIGLNTGPVAAGIIGQDKFLYDLWGDTVNVASRMQTHGLPGEIQVTAATAAALGDAYEMTDRGVIEVKGKKDGIRSYILARPRLSTLPGQPKAA